MILKRYIEQQIKNHSYFIIFFCIGLFLNLDFDTKNVCETQVNLVKNFTEQRNVKKVSTNFIQTYKTSKLTRPRYFSTELGIKEKLFIGVLTSAEQIDGRSLAINKTIAHLVEKIKYFISVNKKYKPTHTLSNIVGFTDTSEILRPFHIIKYIGDTFLQNYDYFYFMKDSTFLNAPILKNIVNKISVSQNVYLGTKMSDSSYCSLDAGILLSNSIITEILSKLDWCVKNSFSDNHSENLGRCIAHVMSLDCQETMQGQVLPSYRLKYYNVENNLKELSQNTKFTRAAVIYPVSTADNFYILKSFFSRNQVLQGLTSRQKLEKKILDYVTNFPKNFQTISWPFGQRVHSRPETRFDVSKVIYFNKTHKYFQNDYFNIQKFTASEQIDIQNVLDAVIETATVKYNNTLKFRRLVNGYRQFDLSRGLDYVFDLGFKNIHSGKEVIKRFDVCKPLGKVEILPMPYVTETNRITILIPTQQHEINKINNFLNKSVPVSLENRQKLVLLFIFLYKNSSVSKGENDIFGKTKGDILNYGRQNANAKAVWLSVRLPNENEIDFKQNEEFYFTIVDLSLRKVGPESLVLILDLGTIFEMDFLNRVRMNTISGTQVFSIIPFQLYNPLVAEYGNRLDINKQAGQFDSDVYRFISFYGKDYVKARHQISSEVPLVRSDKDLPLVLKNRLWTISQMFLYTSSISNKTDNTVHFLRATDSNLKILYDAETILGAKLGSRIQLATFLMSHLLRNN